MCIFYYWIIYISKDICFLHICWLFLPYLQVATHSILFFIFLSKCVILLYLSGRFDKGNFAKLFVGSVPRTATEEDVSQSNY